MANGWHDFHKGHLGAESTKRWQCEVLAKRVEKVTSTKLINKEGKFIRLCAVAMRPVSSLQGIFNHMDNCADACPIVEGGFEELA